MMIMMVMLLVYGPERVGWLNITEEQRKAICIGFALFAI